MALGGPLLSGFIKRHLASRTGLAVGAVSMGLALSGSVGAALTLPLTQAFAGRWPLALAAWALPALGVALAWALWAPREPGGEDARAARASASLPGLPWREPRAWRLAAFFGLQAGLFYALATWMVAHYSEAGYSALATGGFLTTFMFSGAAGSTLVPLLAERPAWRAGLLLGSSGLLCGLLALFALWPAWLPLLVCAGPGVCFGGVFSLALALPIYEVRAPLQVAAWTSMMLSVGYVIASIAPLAAGALRDLRGDWGSAFGLLALAALGLPVLALGFRVRAAA